VRQVIAHKFAPDCLNIGKSTGKKRPKIPIPKGKIGSLVPNQSRASSPSSAASLTSEWAVANQST
jgi:hypothetical protein